HQRRGRVDQGVELIGQREHRPQPVRRDAVDPLRDRGEEQGEEGEQRRMQVELDVPVVVAEEILVERGSVRHARRQADRDQRQPRPGYGAERGLQEYAPRAARSVGPCHQDRPTWLASSGAYAAAAAAVKARQAVVAWPGASRYTPVSRARQRLAGLLEQGGVHVWGGSLRRPTGAERGRERAGGVPAAAAGARTDLRRLRAHLRR